MEELFQCILCLFRAVDNSFFIFTEQVFLFSELDKNRTKLMRAVFLCKQGQNQVEFIQVFTETFVIILEGFFYFLNKDTRLLLPYDK